MPSTIDVEMKKMDTFKVKFKVANEPKTELNTQIYMEKSEERVDLENQKLFYFLASEEGKKFKQELLDKMG
jgi:hypothetical protein